MSNLIKLKHELKSSIYEMKQKLVEMRLKYETDIARTEGIVWAYEKIIDAMELDTPTENERDAWEEKMREGMI